MLEIGAAKADITFYEEGMCMLGWGHPRNTIAGVGMPLLARAVVIRDPARDTKIAYLCADLCFVSMTLHQRVMELLRAAPELGLDAHNTVLTATHTHSGTNGFGGHLYYDISGPGFSERVFESIASAFVAALREADRRRVPGRAYYHTGAIPLGEPVMFNRSPEAYNRNADVVKVSHARADEAVDRTVRALRLDDASGKPIAAVHWIGLHATLIHSDNRLLHPDHSGVAAAEVERWAREAHGSPDFVAIFAQGTSGDVTPNFRLDPARGLRVGRFDDDLASAWFCGSVEARVARAVLEAAPAQGAEIHGPIAGVTRYVRMTRRPVAARFTDGRRDRVTTDARLGLAMAMGTDEGQGPLHALEPLLNALRDRRAKADPEDPKVPFLDLSAGDRGRLFDRLPIDDRVFSIPLPAMGHFRRLARAKALSGPWISTVVPVQLVRLGEVYLAAVPCEPTTVAGRRLRETVRAALSEPARDVIVNGYANANTLYLTTPEEYRQQHYEAGCTLFGPWSLGAYQEALDALASALRGGAAGDLGDEVPPPDRAQLAAGRFVGPH